MDNTNNNSQNFPPSVSNNDINAAAAQANQNPVQTNGASPPSVEAPAPIPTWLPPTPGLVGQQPVSEQAPIQSGPAGGLATSASGVAPPQATTPEPSASWPAVPQDHGSSSPTNGWNPAPIQPGMEPASVVPAESQAMPMPPVSPQVSQPPPFAPPASSQAESLSNPVLQSPAPVSPSWPTDQTMPASPVAPTIPDAAAATSPDLPGGAAEVAPTPTWPTQTPGQGIFAPAVTVPTPADPALTQSASAPVFPPQFSDQTPSSDPTLTPDVGASSFDPLGAVSAAASAQQAGSQPTGWPTSPTNQGLPTTTTDNSTQLAGFATPQPPSNMGGGAFISDPLVSVSGAVSPSAQMPVVSGFNLSGSDQVAARDSVDTNSNSIPTPDTTADLSGMGNPVPSFNPATINQETLPVTPSGIPETVANNNKPRISKLIIIGAVAATLLVLGSASYLLFFSPRAGTPEDTISLPVSDQAPLTKPKLINTPAAAAASDAGTSAGEATSSGSAFDLLKAKTASPSPAAQ